MRGSLVSSSADASVSSVSPGRRELVISCPGRSRGLFCPYVRVVPVVTAVVLCMPRVGVVPFADGRGVVSLS